MADSYLRAQLAVVGGSYYSCRRISGPSFTTALDIASLLAEMDVGAAAPDFFRDLGDRCGHKGATTPN
jgi:hypothetical protein